MLKKSSISFFFLIAAAGASCHSPDVKDLCRDQFPAIQKNLADARVSLAPWLEGRTPASEDDNSPILADDDRHYWQDWALSKIKDTQKYMDLIDSDPSLHEIENQLKIVANELVAFDGYATAGRPDKMTEVLAELEERMDKVRSLACSN